NRCSDEVSDLGHYACLGCNSRSANIGSYCQRNDLKRFHAPLGNKVQPELVNLLTHAWTIHLQNEFLLTTQRNTVLLGYDRHQYLVCLCRIGLKGDNLHVSSCANDRIC